MSEYEKYFGKSKKKTATKRKTAKKSNGVSEEAVKKIVDRAISRNTENKSIQVYRPSLPIVAYNNAGFNSYIFPVSPYQGYAAINQGASASQRIGNVIRIKKAVLKFVIYPLPYNATTNPTPEAVEIKMWLLNDRDLPTTLPSIGADFIQLGGSSVALTSQLQDMISTVNRDQYHVFLEKTYKLGRSNLVGTGVSVAQPYNANNDFKLNVKKSIDITKHLIKTVKYDDNTSDPSTRGVFAVFEAVNADGTTATAATIPAQMSWSLDIQYEDA